MGEVVSLSGRRVSGAEHHVYLDEARGLALKVPNPLGKLWQKMDAAHVERDLSVLREYEIPTVPTRVHKETCAVMANQTRRQVTVALEQPLLRPSHPIQYRDLMYHERIRAFLLDTVRKGEAIYREKDLGLDLLGGKAFLLALSALNPLQKRMQAEVSNLLVADQNIQTPEAWIHDDRRKIRSLVGSAFERRKGPTIARAGEIRLCDIRLFDFDRGEGWLGRNLSNVLRRVHEFQYASLRSILESFGIKSEINSKTPLQSKANWLIQHATPKMRAYVEATESNGGRWKS